MNKVEWSSNYALGIKIIDVQHKKLFNIMNEIYTVSENECDIQKIIELFDELTKYSHYHFNEEETYFSSMSDENIEIHKQQHQFFIDEIEKIKLQCLRINGMSLELLYFLNDWLVNHIKIEDHKYID